MIHVQDCQACKCNCLKRKPGRFEVQNRGPYFCDADPTKELIKYLPKCPKGKVLDYENY